MRKKDAWVESELRASLPSSLTSPTWENSGFPIKNVGNDRREASGTREGGRRERGKGGKPLDSRLKTSGMTEGCVGNDGTAWSPCHTHLVPLSCPPGPSVILTWFPCHAGTPSLMPRQSPPLSFPQVFSGNPVFFSFVLFIRVSPAWEKPLDSRLKTSGMTEGGVGNDRGGEKPRERQKGCRA